MSLHGKRKEIYKYEAPWTVYAMNWTVRPDKRFRLALGSFVEEYNNKVSSRKASCPVMLFNVSDGDIIIIRLKKADFPLLFQGCVNGK